MKTTSWTRTFLTQMFLCFALYVALNVGEYKKYDYKYRIESSPLDLYFISVRGGSRTLNQQTHLLKQMEKIARTSKAEFVVNISELGDDDLFVQNGTQHFSSLKVPWYSTRTTKGHGADNFVKQIKLPYGQTLDIICIDTGPLQDSMLTGSSSEIGNNQLLWLTKTLETASGNWRIVVGFHPLVFCDETKQKMEAKQIFESIHNVFTRFGVNAYVSGLGCRHHIRIGSVAYIGIPGPMEREPCSVSVNGSSAVRRELVDGFLLHRVRSLETVVYYINLAGEAVHRTLLRQWGKEAT